MTSINLGNVGDVSKPATVLIEKVARAIGIWWEPKQIERVALAEAKADMIRAVARIDIDAIKELHERTVKRFVYEELRKQSNMESIMGKAIPALTDEAKPENVEDDWIAHFFDKCRIVSDEEMQQLWSRVLAGEANSPGAFSKRTVSVLSGLDKADAYLFSCLCGFVWDIGTPVPLVFEHSDQFYKRHHINFSKLTHLDSIGLIQFNSITGFVRQRLPKNVTCAYYGRPLQLTLPKDSDNDIGIGQVLLTQVGQQLASICGSAQVEGFYDFVCGKWADKSYLPQIPR